MRTLIPTKSAQYKKNDDLERGKSGGNSIFVVMCLRCFHAIFNTQTCRPTVFGWIIGITLAFYFIQYGVRSREASGSHDTSSFEFDGQRGNPKFMVQKMMNPQVPDPFAEEKEFVPRKNPNLPTHIFNPNEHPPNEKEIEERRSETHARPKHKDYPVSVLEIPDVNRLCNREIELLVVVNSRTENVGIRRSIRRTWAIQNKDDFETTDKRWTMVFVTGTPDPKYHSTSMKEEVADFSDILQGDFIDTPHENTRLFMMSVDWIMKEMVPICKPKYILKTNDDIYINLKNIIELIDETYEPLNPQPLYIGKILRSDVPIRDPNSFNFVPEEDFPRDLFPDMIEGPVYLFSYPALELLYINMGDVVPLSIEDGFIGVLAEKAGVVPKHDKHFAMLRKLNSDTYGDGCHYMKMYFIYHIQPNDHNILFKKIKKAKENNLCN